MYNLSQRIPRAFVKGSSTSSVNSFEARMASEYGGRTGLIVSPFFANYHPPSQIFKLYLAFFKCL